MERILTTAVTSGILARALTGIPTLWLTVLAAWVILLAGPTSPATAQPDAFVGPPFPEVEAAWSAFWNRLVQDDIEGARRYLHTFVRRLVPGNRSLEEWHDIAQQMAFCRLEPMAFPISTEEVMYPARCQRGGETAETAVILRRDRDGAWRFMSPFLGGAP